MTFSRTAPECPGICSASPACVPPPTGAPCDSYDPSCRASLRRCAGRAACNLSSLPSRGRWDYRTPCPDTDVAEIPQLAPASRPRSRRSSFPAASYREHWRRQSQPPSDRRRPRRLCYVLCLICRDPWDLGRRSPPKTRLAHCAVGALPFPVDAAEFITVLDQEGPDAMEYAPGGPSLHRAMHGTVVAELPGQLVPLAAGAHYINNAIQRFPLSCPRPTGRGRRVQFFEDRLNDFPEFVVHLPDRGQRFHRSLTLGHPWLLCWC